MGSIESFRFAYISRHRSNDSFVWQIGLWSFACAKYPRMIWSFSTSTYCQYHKYEQTDSCFIWMMNLWVTATGHLNCRNVTTPPPFPTTQFPFRDAKDSNVARFFFFVNRQLNKVRVSALWCQRKQQWAASRQSAYQPDYDNAGIDPFILWLHPTDINPHRTRTSFVKATTNHESN